MNASKPVRVTCDGVHQVVHLPADVTAPEAAVVRRNGERLIIEPARRGGELKSLLEIWVTEAPLGEHERLPPASRSAPRPFRL